MKKTSINNINKKILCQKFNGQIWVDSLSIWANIIPYRGFEIVNSIQNEQIITHKIIIRYSSQISPDMRIIHNERIFRIKYILNIAEKNEFLEIFCEENSNNN